jgi:hypothetical protein
MINIIAQQLHERYSRGENLSQTEMELLTSWYNEQDSLENAEINTKGVELNNIDTMYAQIQIAAAQLQRISQQIAEVIEVNETLRREIAVLKERLVQQVSGRAA